MTKFVGQQKIIAELDRFIIPRLINGMPANILFRAQSGCGKTKLAVGVALQIVDPDNISYVLPNEEGNIDTQNFKRVVILDEVHEIKVPEVLYPLMDSGNHVFILCSNEFGNLKEPLVNRCYSFTFVPYTETEIAAIIFIDLWENGFLNVNDEVVLTIAENCNLTPRTARKITERLVNIFSAIGVPETREQVQDILREYLDIEGGLNPLHKAYLEYLSKVRRASLDSIIYGVRLDKATILREIEPVLIQKNLIRVTPRGRIIL